jgi:drug/metabolite transporter (DMT)-like permease
MFYLLATTLLATSIFIIFRIFKRLGIDNLQAISANYVVAASIGFMAYSEPFSAAEIFSSSWFPLTFLIGLSFIGVFFLFALSSQKAGVAITAVSSKMSVVIPASAGFLIFGDHLSFIKILGIAAALLAFYLTFRTKGKMVINYAALALPVFLFIGTGTNDTLMKYVEYNFVDGDLLLLISTIFVVALLIGSTLLAIKVIQGKNSLNFKSILAGLLLGFVNFASTYTLFMSMEYFESSLLFPIRNTGVVTLSAFAGILFFREELNRTNWIGISLAVLAIILIALG